MFKNFKLRTKLILNFLIIALPILAIGYFSIYELNEITKPISREIPQEIQEITAKSKMNDLAQTIKYYDEVLTQSARNYAFTRDEKWKNRYDDAAPKLDGAIKEAIANGDEQDKEYFSSVDESNLVLVDMETKSISFTDDDQAEEAVKILESQEYWDQKNIYSLGLNKFISKSGSAESEILKLSTDKLLALNDATAAAVKSRSALIIFLVVLVFLLAIILGITAAYFITKPLVKLENKAQEVSSGKYGGEVDIENEDEIGSLAKSFNRMSLKIKKDNAELEKKIKMRTEDLEKINQFMVGRELKMIELKEENRKLKEALKNQDGKNN